MAITNLQQARQMYQTGQRVAKTLDGSRPGYRGDDAYGPRSKSNQATSSRAATSTGSKSSKSSNTNKAGSQSTGNAKDDYIANYVSKSIVKGGGSKKPGTSGTKPSDYNDAFVTGDDGRSARRDFIQTLNTNNAIRANQLGTKFVPYQGGSRPKPRSGLAGLLMGGLGMLMGVPGLSFLTGGLRNLGTGIMDINNRIQQSDFGRSKNLMDYLDMKKFGGYDERELARAKRMQEARNLQKMMMLSPSATMTPRDYAMQGLTVPDLGDVSSLVQATDRGLLEAPGDNLPVIPNRNIDYNRIKDYAEGYDLSRDAPPSNPYNYGDDLENEFVTEPYQPSGLETLQPITFEEPTFKPYA